MRRALPLLAAAALALVAAAPAEAAKARHPARLQVTADEFTFALSRLRVAPGPVIIQLVNFGEDDHDLRLRWLGVRRAPIRRLPVTTPGGVADRELRLAAGRFRLWCSLADHQRRGMRATLVVRRR